MKKGEVKSLKLTYKELGLSASDYLAARICSAIRYLKRVLSDAKRKASAN